MKLKIRLTVFSLCILMFTCCGKKDDVKKVDDLKVPLNLTFEVTNVSVFNGANGSINLTVNGGKKPYAFLWSNGAVTEDLTSLIAGSYSVKITDADAQVLEKSFSVSQPNLTGTIKDSEGNTYKTVLIGNQWWMAENLKSTKDANGNAIESYAYNNDESKVAVNGRLYSWDNALKASPSGWHLASDQEWKTLEKAVGMSASDADRNNSMDRGVGIAKILLQNGSSGFDALYSGYYWWSENAKYDQLGSYAVFWTATESSADKAWARTMATSTTTIYRYEDPKNCRFSVRCVKD